MASSQTTSIKDWLQNNQEKLASKELDLVLALALHKNKEYLYKHPEKKLSISTIKKANSLLQKRLSNYSLAYLRKYKEFFNLKFLVSKHTLIPRPESELIVEEAIKYLPKHKPSNVIDLGTGTGCLILTIAKHSQGNFLGTDISTKALQIAKTNARKLKIKVLFIKSDLFKNIPSQKFNLVLANLPYLTPTQLKETSLQKEPSLALVSGQDGLDHYRKFFKQLPDYLDKEYLILIEIDPQQQELITEIIKKALPQTKIEFLKDLNNNIRVVKISN